MEAETGECFTSASEARNFMPYELSYRNPNRRYGELWIFWSRCADDLENVLRGFNASTSRKDTIKQKIQTFLLHLRFFFTYSSNTLIQFWAPVRIAHKICLTTADQPFAIPQLRKGLFSYRKLCLESISIPEDGDEEQNLGPPGRVFRQGFPEFCGDISDYLKTEYRPRDCALEFGLKFYTALPLFDSGEKECIGVLEIISESNIYDFLVGRVFPALQKMNITFGIYESFYRNCLSGQVVASPKVHSLMLNICRQYQLPLAQMWLTQMGERSHIYRVSQMPIHNSEILHLFEGQGVVGKALSSRSSCFCHDITKLSINVYPMVPLARKLELSSCFAICLKGRHNDRIYILEFFFQSSVIDFGDPRNVVVKLVEDLEKEIGESENSFLQKLEKTLFVVVTRFSSDPDILHSFEIKNSKSPTSVSKDPQGMMSYDSLHPEVSGTDDEMGSHSTELDHQCETSGEPSIEPTTPIDEENIVQYARIKDEKNTLDVQYGITRDVLLQHSGKKLQDVAKFFGVSRSTLKRICRKHGIYRWHQNRSRKSTSSHKDIICPSNENTDANNTPNTMEMRDDNNSITIKAAYGEDIWRFQLSISAKKIDLEQQLMERINSTSKSLKIKYLDEENEWISVSCDADLKLCIDACRSQGKTIVKVLVVN